MAREQVSIERSGIAESATANIAKRITESTMKTDPKKVIKIVEEMTRAGILARLGNIACDIDWYSIYLKKKDELCKYLFGTSDYTILGIQWGLLLKPKNKKQIINESIDDMLGDL